MEQNQLPHLAGRSHISDCLPSSRLAKGWPVELEEIPSMWNFNEFTKDG